MASNVYTIGGETIRFPWECRAMIETDDERVCVLKSWKERYPDPSVDIADPSRNVVSIRTDGEIRWVVDRTSWTESRDEYYHERVYEIGDRIVSQSNAGHFHEIARDSGQIRSSWRPDQLEISTATVDFESPVRSLDSHDEYVLVVTDDFIYVYTHDGTPLWRRSVSRKWSPWRSGDPFTLRASSSGAGPGWDLTVDPETGEITQTKGKGKPSDLGTVEEL